MKKNSVFILIFLFLIPFTALLFSATNKKEDQTKYIYLVRHAEKDLTDSTDNPPLTPAGEARAERLVKEFESIPLDQIFSTRYQRNMNTVGPLAKFKNKSVEIYESKGTENLVNKIKSTASKSILICGHSDNILQIIEYFGGKSPLKELGHNEYDKLFKITYNPKKTKVKMWTY